MFLFFVCQGHYGRHNNEWPPKSVHVLKSWTCEYVNLCGIRDFVDVTKLKTLRWGWCWITQGPNLAIWILESREPPPPRPFFFLRSESEGNVIMEEWTRRFNVAGFEDVWRGLWAKKYEWPLELEEARKKILP